MLCPEREAKKNDQGAKNWYRWMSPNLERKVLQSVGDTGFVLEPTSGLDQKSDGGSGLAIVNGSDLDTAGGVDDGSKRACETRGVANGSSRCAQHLVDERKTKGGRGLMEIGGYSLVGA